MFPKMRKVPVSLSKRVIVTSLIGAVLLLFMLGTMLIWAFNQSLMRSVYHQLGAFNDLLIASTSLENGKVELRNPELLATIPRYWQVRVGQKLIRHSPFFEDQIMIPNDKIHWRFTTLEGERLLISSTDVIFPEGKKVTYIFGMQEEIADAFIDAQRGPFLLWLLAASIVMCGAVLLLTRLQLYMILSPLRQIRHYLESVQKGDRKRLDGNVPKEIKPLTDQINSLLDYSEAVIDRYRSFASNLSHTMKTSLAVMANEASTSRGQLALLVKEKTALLQGVVDRHLSRVKIAGPAHILGSQCELSGMIERIGKSFAKLYDIQLQVENSNETILFNGDEHDMYELLGNIIENACKYAKEQVLIMVIHQPNEVTIQVHDDGPGIDPKHYAQVLERGKRLDQSKPGTGIGLSISQDIIQLYKGRLELSKSHLNGLCVRITLPLSLDQ